MTLLKIVSVNSTTILYTPVKFNPYVNYVIYPVKNVQMKVQMTVLVVLVTQVDKNNLSVEVENVYAPVFMMKTILKVVV